MHSLQGCIVHYIALVHETVGTHTMVLSTMTVAMLSQVPIVCTVSFWYYAIFILMHVLYQMSSCTSKSMRG